MSNETTDLVARAKATLEGVARGPWRWTAYHDRLADERDRLLDASDDPVIETGIDGCGGDAWSIVAPPDAAFIAASRELVPELVAEVERLRMHVANEELVNAALAEKLNEAITGVASIFDDDVREAMAQSGAETIPDLVRGCCGAVDHALRQREEFRAEVGRLRALESRVCELYDDGREKVVTRLALGNAISGDPQEGSLSTPGGHPITA